MVLRRDFVASDGYRISYLVAGSGPVLVLIPAMLQSAESWESAGYIERFASRNRVIAVDPLGHGRSDAPDDPHAYAPEAVAERLVEVIEHEAATSVCMWGYSLGSHTASLIARRRPDMATGVVAGSLFLGDVDTGLQSLGTGLENAVETAVTALEQGDWDTFFAMHMDDIGPALRERHEAESSPEALAALARAHLLWPRTFLMPSMPTMVYWHSDELYADHNLRLVERLPVEWAVVPGPHRGGFERMEEVAPLVERFLASLDRS